MILRALLFLGVLLALSASSASSASAASPVVNPYELDAETAGRFADLALACVHKEYPNKIAHSLNGDKDVKPPRQLTPAFYGCYDWHSAVHGHWLLARLARRFPTAPFAAKARAALEQSLTAANVAAEVRYLEDEGRASFERPYGLAWLLQLAAELKEWDDPQAKKWSETLQPLVKAAVGKLTTWLPKLSHPVRTGEHNQTAFSLGLMIDWARTAGDAAALQLFEKRARELFFKDRVCPLDYEPSGEDFLSPCLAEADLVRRLVPPEVFAEWLSSFLPQIGSGDWLIPGVATDRTDGKLVHLDGLNLSRAWMLEGIAASLPENDSRVPRLRLAAYDHRDVGLVAVTGKHYEGGHWLGSFAAYLLTGRGLPPGVVKP
ncbi:MAG TPA: DUF2891 domain-containing protein [Thermoanaerobaculia bacterium]|nr:DUF2891 domain-containing protein [Thermoanaerobaculia bacterium]